MNKYEKTNGIENETELRKIENFKEEYTKLCEKHEMTHRIIYHNSNLAHDPYPHLAIVYKCKSYK